MLTQYWRTFSHTILLETVLWTQCSSQHNTMPLLWAFLMFSCLLKYNMGKCFIINACILYLSKVQVRLLLYLCSFIVTWSKKMCICNSIWVAGGEYVCYNSSTFITSDNYNTMYVWKIWQSLAFDTLVSLPLDVFLRFLLWSFWSKCFVKL